MAGSQSRGKIAYQISLWDYEAFEETKMACFHAFKPCLTRSACRWRYLSGCDSDQRSNDMLVAHHINAMQYVALRSDDCLVCFVAKIPHLLYVSYLLISTPESER